jgi:LmbE family N-acetylglucosaminyl deacetylase
VTEKIIVLAPHPDDEVLGVGGTMARASARGAEVYVVVLTIGQEPLFAADSIEETRCEMRAAHKLLNVKDTICADLPAAALDTVPHWKVNRTLVDIFERIEPDVVYLPFVGDIHLDHQLSFLSAMVASRPTTRFAPKTIYAYETLSETNWNAPYLTPGFAPNVFVDISDYLELKIEAMQAFATQVKPPPHERSVEALRALATLRGATVCREAAEAFVLIRQLL